MIINKSRLPVFVLYTPLHVLIALRVIKLKKMDKFAIIYIAKNTKKNDFYFKKISKNSFFSEHIKETKSGIKEIIQCIYCCLKLKVIEDIDIYFANIKKIYSRVVCGILKANHIYSIDDGSGNISGDGYFYDFTEPFLKKIFLKIIFPSQKLSYKILVDRLVRNYTIFQHENVYEKVSKRIQLFEYDNTDLCQRIGRKCFYLGNAFSEDGECEEWYERKIFERADREFSIDFYLPHPRECIEKSFRIAKNKVLFETDKIAEDLVISYVKKGYCVDVIGIYSTTLLNLLNVYGVRCVNINATLRKPTKTLRNLLAAVGVEQVDMQNERA